MDGVAAGPSSSTASGSKADPIPSSTIEATASSSSSQPKSKDTPTTSPLPQNKNQNQKDENAESTDKLLPTNETEENPPTLSSNSNSNSKESTTRTRRRKVKKKSRSSVVGNASASASTSVVSTPKTGTPRPEKDVEEEDIIVLSSGSDGEAKSNGKGKGKQKEGSESSKTKEKAKRKEHEKEKKNRRIENEEREREEGHRRERESRSRKDDRKRAEKEKEKDRRRDNRKREREGSLSLNRDLEIIDMDAFGDEDRDRDDSDRKMSKSKSKTKRQPVANGSTSKSFEESADFIPLADSDSDEDGIQKIHTSSSSKKRKGKERADEEDIDKERRDGSSRKRRKSRSRSRSRERDDREHNRDRNKDRRGRDRDRSPPDREWDRGKRKREDDRYARRGPPPASASVRSLGGRRLPWIDGLDFDKCRNVAELLHMEVEAFTKWISPSPVEDEIRNLLVTWITRAITQRFPDATVLPFGSYATKLYLPTGDIDLVVLSDTMAYNSKQTVLRTLADTIRRNNIANNISVIAKAKVPIIKFVTKAEYGGIPVDISINQPNGEVGARMVGGFLKDMKVVSSSAPLVPEEGEVQSSPVPGTHLEGSLALRALIVLTKQFLSQRSMNEVFTGGLSSYSITVLVISFLQMHPKIRRGEVDPERNLGTMVMDFFELYGCYFNYENVGISVREGGRYFDKKRRGWVAEYSGGGGRGGRGGGGMMLSIEDPADPSNDISSGSYAFPRVRTTFAGAYNILKATAFLKAGIISSRKKGNSVRFSYRDRDVDAEEDMSILGHILDVGQDMINHRHIVQEVYDRRTLHNLLGIKPRPVVVSHATNEVDSLSAGTVSRVWNAPEDDDEDHFVPDSRSRRHASDDDDEGGRYAIGKQPPNKRRKIDADRPVVSFTTDESEAEDETNSDADSLMEEEGEYDLDFGEFKIKGSASVEKRSYWLSKGVVE